MAPPELKSKTLLALDTATTGCSACVWRGTANAPDETGETLALEDAPMARGQAQELMPMIDRVLQRASVEPAALDGVIVTRGPGAFTGLRIALSTARGFAMALGVPCLGVTTLEAVAHNVAPQARLGHAILVCVESKRADLYAQAFDETLAPLSEPLALDGDGLGALTERHGPVLLAGDAAQRALDWLVARGVDARLADAHPLPRADVIARLGALRFEANAHAPEPLYLRPPDAKRAVAGGRRRP